MNDGGDFSFNQFACTIIHGRGLPSLPLADTLTISPREYIINHHQDNHHRYQFD